MNGGEATIRTGTALACLPGSGSSVAKTAPPKSGATVISQRVLGLACQQNT
jgi:hypothetical protein